MDSAETNQELLLRLVGIWWAGVKVFVRWSAFWIVLTVFWLPLLPLIYLAGERAARVLVGTILVLCVPFVFYLTSRYLHLLGDDASDVTEPPEGSTPAVESRDVKMRRKIGISMFIAFFAAFLLLSPSPDPFSAVTLGTGAALLCGIPLLVLARFRFLKSASAAVHTLVAGLVCALAISLLACLLFIQRIAHM